MKTSQAALLKIPVTEIKLSYRDIRKVLQNPLETLRAITKKHGGIAELRILHKRFIIVENPDYFKCILQEQYKNFYKYDLSGLLTKFLGEGLINSNGPIWLQQRRIIQPAFHKHQMESMVGIIHDEVDKLIGSIKKENCGRPIEACKLFMKLNFGIMAGILFGETGDNEIKMIAGIMNDLAIEAENQVTQIIKLPLNIPSPANLRFKKIRKKFDSLLYSIINTRKKQVAERVALGQDVLQMLLMHRNEKSEVIPDKQIRDELTTLFMAGYETTSQTLSWLFYQIARQTEIAVSIREEMNKFNSAQRLAVHDLAKLKYTTSVIKETMRFYPAVWLMVRKNISSAVLAPYYLPKRSILLMNVYGMHRNQTYWEKPDEFRPNRFNDDNIGEQHPFSYLPFGIGPRVCIGQQLAMTLMQIVVSRLISCFDCIPADKFEIAMDPKVTLRPKPAIYFQLTPIAQH